MSTHLFVGCSLTFDTSNKIGFIPGDPVNFDESFVIVPNNNFYPYNGDFCYPNFIPSIGELYVQDYPNNINSKVWIKDAQTSLINTSIIYNEVQRKMVYLKYPLCQIPSFHLISQCGKCVGRHSFRIILGELPGTMRKLCLSTKLPVNQVKCQHFSQ